MSLWFMSAELVDQIESGKRNRRSQRTEHLIGRQSSELKTIGNGFGTQFFSVGSPSSEMVLRSTSTTKTRLCLAARSTPQPF
jgi:hypothetical protein